ncbi:hypothetical protein [Aurantiacibacter spongiae]|uniref:Nucleotidyltransferase domain-containing protein n=1 Tax=Aurantiacibacter spongiae TaxID=2488860 RepID=A0A3N5CPZ0_9SPHN|nr:hypothetical protein [Aurantiacibacter spongiae]RPF70436.1 hypothetical protein EG799_01430 [Aurantiacibacter spongiae]
MDAFLDEVLDDLRLAARGCGYALAVHGSRARDIDMIAIPWTEQAEDAKLLVQRLCGVLAGHLGRALPEAEAEWAEKPHGRRAVTIIMAGAMSPEIDLSIMPKMEKHNA